MIKGPTSTFTLDPEKGQEFAQFRNNIVASGVDLPYPKKLLEKKDQELTEPPTFWLEEVGPNQHISPVYGVRGNKQ